MTIETPVSTSNAGKQHQDLQLLYKHLNISQLIWAEIILQQVKWNWKSHIIQNWNGYLPAVFFGY